MSASGKPTVGTALGWFNTAWLTCHPHAYEPTDADIGQLARLIRRTSKAALEDLPRAFANYMADVSPYVAREHAHSLALFCTRGGINKYRATPEVLSRSDATTISAGQQWLLEQDGCDANGRRRDRR